MAGGWPTGGWPGAVQAVVDAIDDAEEVVDSGALADEWQSDLGNARRLVARHGRNLKYTRQLGWLGWDGRRWVRDDGAAVRAAHATAEAILEEVARLRERGPVDGESQEAFEKRIARHWKLAVESGNHGRMTGMVKSAAPYLEVRHEDLDQRPLRLNVMNGTLHLDRERVTLMSHRRSDLATRLADVTYDAEAVAPGWLKFVAEVLPDVETRAFVQRWLGYALSGDISEQRMVVLEGKGANGKSTLVDVVARILGEYAATVPIETFLHQDKRGGSGPTPDLARLPGVRLVRTSEPEPGARISESLIKQFTGGERIAARHLHRDMFEFTPSGKLTMSVNVKPVIVGKDHGIRRRIMVVPFKQTFARGPGGLTERLLTEATGILNWLLDGWLMWREDGLGTCPEVDEATAAYFAEMDPIGSFVADCCEQRNDYKATFAQLKAAYRKWCDEVGEDAKSDTAFGRRLTDLGFGKHKSGGTIYRAGVALTREWRDRLTVPGGGE